MAAIETPLTATVSNAELDNATLNPTLTNTQAIVHITLKFDGVQCNPDNIYDMVDAQYGTVRSEKGANSSAHSSYIFKISA